MESTNNDPFRHPGLSSPVILVFMAIGVCSTAGMSFFAWKRFLLAHNPAVFQARNRSTNTTPRYWAEPIGSRVVDVGRKPVVFDRWTTRGSTEVDWGRILPLSLTYKEASPTAQIAFSIAFPGGQPYAIGLTEVDIITTENKNNKCNTIV